MAIAQILWKTLYRRWPPRRQPPSAGYSLLVPVPGDLPVFLKIALAVLRKQDPAHRLETIVIPDLATDQTKSIVAAERPTWRGELRLLEMPWPDRWIPKNLNRPHHNHWLQLINGARQARGQYALLHDADLFLAEPRFLQEQFSRCVAGDFSCFGVHRVWDPWYERHGKNLTATWEMFFDVDWLRTYPPYLHLGHAGMLDGQPHTFDTTLYPQCLTPAEKIGWYTPPTGLIHFNYVICSYRYFLDATESYEDEQFRLLLIRLLVDLFDRGNPIYRLPTLDQLTHGLTDSTAAVTYCAASTAKNYAEFRGKWNELLGCGLLSADQGLYVNDRLSPFDRHFGYVTVA
jgi:hypothetical protein